MEAPTDTVAVAISTTGHPHRKKFLETAVAAWSRLLGPSQVVVTVDACEYFTTQVRDQVRPDVAVVRVGQPQTHPRARQGVAANKNTGLEYVMGLGLPHIFLADDDAFPLSDDALALHTDYALRHSMVCWGRSRHESDETDPGTGLTWAQWSWPRGVVLYAHREVVETVGGFVEAFGAGGHEHAEWSQRIHNAGLTPCDFPTPVAYSADKALGARRYWSCVDMKRPHETSEELDSRRARVTTITRTREDWARIDKMMKAMHGSSAFVDYAAEANGRSSATMS